MQDKMFETSVGESINQPGPEQSIERVAPDELDTVARVLAIAYAEDPVHLWAMPKATTRLNDAIAFFTFFLRRMRPHRWEVFATKDRSAVAIIAPVGQKEREYGDGTRYMPVLLNRMSHVTDFFQWIETFRPDVEHQYLEFIGCLPMQRSRGLGSLLLGSLLSIANREGIPVWSWSSNPRNLTFYQRLGFEIGEELRRDDSSPIVTVLWHSPVPLKT